MQTRKDKETKFEQQFVSQHYQTGRSVTIDGAAVDVEPALFLRQRIND